MRVRRMIARRRRLSGCSRGDAENADEEPCLTTPQRKGVVKSNHDHRPVWMLSASPREPVAPRGRHGDNIESLLQGSTTMTAILPAEAAVTERRSNRIPVAI